LLTFGRFLGFVPIGTSSGRLTEGAFRDRWSETNENRDERKRFEEVAHQLGIDLAPVPELPPVAPPLLPESIKTLEAARAAKG
jgi:hypothetical protein